MTRLMIVTYHLYYDYGEDLLLTGHETKALLNNNGLSIKGANWNGISMQRLLSRSQFSSFSASLVELVSSVHQLRHCVFILHVQCVRIAI